MLNRIGLRGALVMCAAAITVTTAVAVGATIRKGGSIRIKMGDKEKRWDFKKDTSED